MKVEQTYEYFKEMIDGCGAYELCPCGKDDMEMTKIAFSALEKQIPKKPKHIHEEYEKHQWIKDEDGNIDVWASSYEFHNGPMCERCYDSVCIHCNPNYDEEHCIVDKDVCPSCNKELSGWHKEKYCAECGQALDWGQTE